MAENLDKNLAETGTERSDQRSELHSPSLVAIFLPAGRAAFPDHELQQHEKIARRLASLKGLEYGGIYSAPEPLISAYVMPTETLDREMAEALGIRSEDDFFGGVVPCNFAATKAITHPLVSTNAIAPEGWCTLFPQLVGDSVLAGFTTFSRKDALRAGAVLLKQGGLRLKPVKARGGVGQAVIRDQAELERKLVSLDEDISAGLVLEENLKEVTTYSVGQVRVAGLVASYYGIQRSVRNNAGEVVYGGSDLIVIRGDLTALQRRENPEAAQRAIAQARVFDDAASDCFEGFLASRRNYDVAQGLDRRGTWRSGVLEQSWRVGGATSAEVLALEAFQADSSLDVLRASSVEKYGEETQVPEGAITFYRGSDEYGGSIVKYAMVET